MGLGAHRHNLKTFGTTVYGLTLHDFESALCYWAFFFGVTAHLGSLLRTIFGPMPEFYCWWIIFCRNVMGNGMQLSLDCNIIFRVRILCNLCLTTTLYILLHNIRILNDTF